MWKINYTNTYYSNVSLECWFLRPNIRLLHSIQGQTCHGCINYDILVGLLSELLMRLSYYIHWAYGKKFSTLASIELRTGLSIKSPLLQPLDQGSHPLNFCVLFNLKLFQKAKLKVVYFLWRPCITFWSNLHWIYVVAHLNTRKKLWLDLFLKFCYHQWVY